MASVLKRKRFPVEATDSLKRSKSREASPNSRPLLNRPLGAAVPAHRNGIDILQNNNNNGETGLQRASITQADTVELGRHTDRGQESVEDQSLRRLAQAEEEASSWKLSDPIGGRMINVDPLFSIDEKYVGSNTNVSGLC